MELVGFCGSTGSSEKSGSRLPRRRTSSAMERYSKFTAAAGSMVGATPTMLVRSSTTRQHMPRETGQACSLAAVRAFRGMRATFHPMSNSSRRSFFTEASFCSRSCSRSLMSRSKHWAAHSPCMICCFVSWLEYAISPMGSWQWLHSRKQLARRWLAGFAAAAGFRSRCRSARTCSSGCGSNAPSSVFQVKDLRFQAGRATPSWSSACPNLWQ
mmetsp:Transcript_74774/g.206133  ORF Transcript_74774/g.206133 Transcript_74774/m.206133 type:complete len:213 (+) Transcript_74774:2055-2693(+)